MLGVESEVEKAGWLQKLWLSFVGQANASDISSAHQLQHSLQATSVKVVQLQHQIDSLQSQRSLEMMQLARAYQEVSGPERQQLPELLRNLLDHIEAEYF